MPRIDLAALTLWITADAVRHPETLADRVAERCGVTRPTATRALKRLAEARWLAREGTGRHTRWQPGLLRQVVRRYPLDGLQEDLPWVRDFAPYFALPEPVERIAQHLFGELVNNAVDHSGGSSVTVSMRQTPAHLQLLVSDDGRGLFDHVRERFALDDPALAMIELSKGKLTSQPERHTGRGLYFAARLADVLDLHANETGFAHRAWLEGGWLPAARPLPRRGTSVYAAVALDTPRTLAGVMADASCDGQGIGFDRTRVALRLLTSRHAALDSRAQARRVASRLEQFRVAEVDFAGVPAVGHGFADELFRVMARERPGVDLVPLNMTAAVAAVVDSVRSPLSRPLNA